MKHPDWFKDLIEKQFNKSNIHKDKSKPPRSIECVLGHKLDPVWEEGSTISYWAMPDPEMCKECELQEQRAFYMDTLLDRFSSIGIPAEHQEYSLNWTPARAKKSRPFIGERVEFRDLVEVDSHNKHVYNACLKQDRKGWLLLSGPVGTGKTTFASALMMDMIQTDRQIYAKATWTTEAGLFRACDIAGAKDYAYRVKTLDKHMRSGLLLIDDLGASLRGLTDWQGGAMRDLFDYRYSNHLPTLLTTNISTWEKLADRYGEHVVSRMQSRCRNMNVLDGPDRRRR